MILEATATVLVTVVVVVIVVTLNVVVLVLLVVTDYTIWINVVIFVTVNSAREFQGNIITN